MAQPRPSCTIIMDIDESLVDDDVRLEIKRSYTHVGSALIRTHESTQGSENTIQLMARLGNREFMDSSVEGADELWHDVMERWLYNEFHNIGNNMMIYNRRQEENGTPELYFDWFEVELGEDELQVRMRLDSNSMVAPEDSVWVSTAREKLNAGVLGGAVKRISMPSAASYEQQKAVGEAAAAARAAEEEAKKAAAEKEAAEALREAEKKAAENFLEKPEPTEAELRAAEEERIMGVLEDRYGVRDADFVIDYAMWDIEYKDGSVRQFDSSTGKFVE